MKEYDIKITETLERTVTVQADSKAEAEERVKDAYYNQEHILDSEDFSGVDFGTQDEREIQLDNSQLMDVLLIKPGMYPQQVQIGKELEDLQAAIGGDIEETFPFDEEVAVVTNALGKSMGMEMNRSLRSDDGEILDVYSGNFLIVGTTEEDWCSLSPELIKQFEEKFHQPEMFVKMGRGFMAMPIPADKVKKSDAPEKVVPTVQKSSPNRDTL